jgi:hypothetical protein
MSEHRFGLGQKVRFSRGYPHRSAPDDFYEVVRQLPETDGEPYYRIKSSREPHGRVVKENEIQMKRRSLRLARRFLNRFAS